MHVQYSAVHGREVFSFRFLSVLIVCAINNIVELCSNNTHNDIDCILLPFMIYYMRILNIILNYFPSNIGGLTYRFLFDIFVYM